MASLNSSTDISFDSTFDSAKNVKLIPKNNDQNITDPLVDMILAFYLRHNLTLVCLEDHMKILNEGREYCDKLPTAKKQIIELFRENRDVFTVFYFEKCYKCQKSTKIDPNSKEKTKCAFCECVLKKTETNFFVIIPIEQQIRQSIKENWSYISKFNTSGNDEGNYSDAHDGKILKSLLEEYKDSDINLLSLCLNLDGANKFNSNSSSLWPIQLSQNYLPPKIRFQPRNIIVGGFYYSNVKLNCREFLLPLVQEFNHLKDNNIKMDIENEAYTFKPVITHCAVDLPAKSMLQEFKQFGSYDGCTYCDIAGELVAVKSIKKKNRKKNSRNYQEEAEKFNKFVRYVEGDKPCKLRDEHETLEKMLAVHTSRRNTAIDGIKDVSCLVGLEHFNIVYSIGVDYMHGCLLGVEKRLMNYFLNPNYSNQKYYITKEKRKLLNSRILSIKPPAYIVRKPRSMDQRANFKASEYRSLLLYYLPVCLSGLLPHIYVEHVRLFSAAVYILLKASISTEEVNKAEIMLNKFVAQHQVLFGKDGMVMVVHLLKHLAESVRQLGPLWCHSAFPFERNNGCLLKLVNGTSDVLLQVSTKYTLAKALLLSVKHEPTKIHNKILLGKSVKITEKSLCVTNIETCETLTLSNEEISMYKRVRLGNTIYSSLIYTRPKRSINYFVGLKDGTFGMAKFYFEYQQKIYVVMDEFETIDSVHHILKVQKTSRNIMAPINDIVVKYLYMRVGIHQYIISEPNPYEIE